MDWLKWIKQDFIQRKSPVQYGRVKNLSYTLYITIDMIDIVFFKFLVQYEFLLP